MADERIPPIHMNGVELTPSQSEHLMAAISYYGHRMLEVYGTEVPQAAQLYDIAARCDFAASAPTQFEGRVMPQVEGMTLRDWFAGLAMQAALSGSEPMSKHAVVGYAYLTADLMLEARGSHDEE